MRRVFLMAVLLISLVCGPLFAQQSASESADAASATPASSCASISLGSNSAPADGTASSTNTNTTQTQDGLPMAPLASASDQTGTQAGNQQGETMEAPCGNEGGVFLCEIDGVSYKGCTELSNGDVDCSQAVPAQ